MQTARESAPGFTDEPDGLRNAMRRFHSVADKEQFGSPEMKNLSTPLLKYMHYWLL
jgi:hypothetical protein